MAYGVFCPECGAPTKTRTRGIPARDTCENGHTYLAERARTKAMEAEITRLTKELEAARQREAEAEARGIEMAASLVEVTTTGAASREVVDLIRALKSTHESNTQGGEG